ncbi:hypothetical protein OEZ85_002092 [Tetradesmus obliquus]|uniref:Uncharacterized protein n=1 Tax=Tetradesmus obliquus TaxID=3088 RepID=A0ABY8U1W3_TETOB|nr:hypothetical protein OEZ85_002092 [Tetradesmus obliquus]
MPAERALKTPVQFSFVYLMHSSWWDALAPFNDTAKTILPAATLPRQPPTARTNSNMNTVWMFTLLRLCEWFLPAAVPGMRSFMVNFMIDPNFTAKDTGNMRGMGNYVADVWIKHALQDGLNRDGSAEHAFNRANYSDYGPDLFIPSNDAFTLHNPTKWQPLLETNELGYFFIQHHITPQIRHAKGFSLGPDGGAGYTVASMYPEEGGSPSQATLNLMRNQTDEVLAASATLTDTQKMRAEWFDDKLISLAPVAFWLAIVNRWDTHTLLGATLAIWDTHTLLRAALAMNCVYDATIVSWREKLRHNAVRPVSLVRHFYGNTTVKAYAGRSAGTQDIKGSQWNSYIRTMLHAEYPSGTSGVCAAYGEFMRRFLNSDSFQPPINVLLKKGCSRREPGLTPAQDIPMVLSSIDEMVQMCGLSRLHAGVHFKPSITAGAALGKPIGEKCFARYTEVAGVGDGLAKGAAGEVAGGAKPGVAG